MKCCGNLQGVVPETPIMPTDSKVAADAQRAATMIINRVWAE
jgi:hypothetical protein